jgi:hypothetical protein
LGVNHVSYLKTLHVSLSKNGKAVMDFFPNVAKLKSFVLDTNYQIKVDAYSDFVLDILATDTSNVVAEKTFDFHVHY